MKARTAFLAGALAALGCSPQKSVPVYPQASVVLITIDTLRADHLALYGYREGRTPNLDALGREGIVFDDAIAQVPLTLPAHASLFTGLLPPRHGVRDNIGFRLKEGHKTLAERFKTAGLATGGAVSAYVLRSQTGISRGFDVYDDALVLDAADESLGALQRDGAYAVASLLRFVESQGGKRFFAFLHLYEPHSPWSPPAGYLDLKRPYDGDIAYADELVGRFLEGLRARGLADSTILALTSDHGEGLGDHGEQEHGLFLYREAVHVPLILRLPGSAGGGVRVAGAIAQVDIAPTLLDLAGLPFDSMDGISLRPALQSGRSEGRTVYSETLYPRYHFGWSELYASADDRFHYIRAPRPELYDRTRDKTERENIAPERAQTVAAMDAWVGRIRSAVVAPEAVDAQTREKLAALGYIGASAVTAGTSSNLADPKDKIAAYEDLRMGLAFRASGRHAEAALQLQKVVADNPLMTDAWETLGLSLISLGREKEGMEALDQAIRLDPTRAEPHMALAKLYALDGKMARAISHAEMATRTEPGKSLEILAQIMMDDRREAEALTFARRSIAADPDRSMSLFILGTVARQHGRCEEALAYFHKATAATERAQGSVVRSLHFQAGDCLARGGREAEAEREFLAELSVLPRSVEGRVALATLYRSQGRDQESRTVLGDLVSGDPTPNAESYWAVVRTFTVLGDLEAARSFAAKARERFPGDARFR
jgi:arylsulfatase A-like enzyme/tetratricopeptide (TPR) repeat protein